MSIDDKIAKIAGLPKEVAEFQHTYHPLHLMCAVQAAGESLGDNYLFRDEIQQYASIYNRIVDRLRDAHQPPKKYMLGDMIGDDAE